MRRVQRVSGLAAAESVVHTAVGSALPTAPTSVGSRSAAGYFAGIVIATYCARSMIVYTLASPDRSTM